MVQRMTHAEMAAVPPEDLPEVAEQLRIKPPPGERAMLRQVAMAGTAYAGLVAALTPRGYLALTVSRPAMAAVGT